MDSLNTEVVAMPAVVLPVRRAPYIWKFWGTALWGLVVFAAMFVGQMAVLGPP